MHAVVVAGSRLEHPLDTRLLDGADLLVAADGGAEALARVGRRPDVLVGDMDSIEPATLRRLREGGTEVLTLPTAKDETDLESALRAAVDRSADRITVLGALGGPRLDHMVGTILLLTSPWLAGRDVRLLDPWHEVFLAQGDARLAGSPGDTVSLLPLSRMVVGVRTEGLAYPLRGEVLHQAATRGVSNEMSRETARVTHGEGRLLLIHYRGDRRPAVHFEEE